MITIKGLQPKQSEIAKSIIESSNKFHIINASRQSGKSYLIARLSVYYALLEPGVCILITSPSHDQTKITFNNIVAMTNINKVIFKVSRSIPFEIQFKNGSKMSFRSSENIDSLRGGTYKYIIIDEFAFSRKGILNIIRQTTVTKKNAKIILTSTPNGIDSDFYTLAMLGMENTPNYSYYFMHYTDNELYDLTEVEDAKLRMPEILFLQEYEGKFMGGEGDVFDGIEFVSNIESWQDASNEQYYAGLDIGRANDFTVLTILNRKKEVVHISRFNKISWELIVIKISEVLNKYKPIIYVETNGIGDIFIENIKKLYPAVNPFITSNSSKKEIIESLKYDITTRNISLPTRKLFPELSSELSTFTVKLSQSGNVIYGAKEGCHDDTVMSLAIANHVHKLNNKKIRIQSGIVNPFYN